MLSRLFGRILALANVTASLWILILMVLICADVLSRGLANAPLHGVPEIARFSIIVMLWMQMPYALRVGRHLRSGVLLDRLPAAGRRMLHALNGVVGTVMFAILAVAAFPELRTVFAGGDFEGAYPVRILLWPIWTVFIVGAALTSIQYALITIAAILGRTPEPGEPASGAGVTKAMV